MTNVRSFVSSESVHNGVVKQGNYHKVSYFAVTNFRRHGKLFGILQEDRLFHVYVIGKTGTGKTNLLTSLALQDVMYERGLFVFDISGDMSHTIIKYIPEHRTKDLVYLNLADKQLRYRYNPLRYVSSDKRSLVTSSLLETFKILWKGAWGVKLEHILRYIILTLLEFPSSTILDIQRIIVDEPFRNRVLKHIGDPTVQRFWKHEFPKFTKVDLLPILTKVGSLTAHPTVRRFLVENPDELSLRRCMDQQQIVVLNVSKGFVGSDVAFMVSALLLNATMNAGFSRIDTPEQKRSPFYLYLDEFQNYSTNTVISMLAEIRKWKLGLVLANQYFNQLDPDIRSAVLGNVGTLISFRVGHADAKYLAQEFHPVFVASDFVNLENYDIYLRLMIRGKPSIPFSASTARFTYILTLPT